LVVPHQDGLYAGPAGYCVQALLVDAGVRLPVEVCDRASLGGAVAVEDLVGAGADGQGQGEAEGAFGGAALGDEAGGGGDLDPGAQEVSAVGGQFGVEEVCGVGAGTPALDHVIDDAAHDVPEEVLGEPVLALPGVGEVPHGVGA